MAVETRTNQRFAEFAATKGMFEPSVETPNTIAYGLDSQKWQSS
jgi:hypothetical protein